MLVTRVATPCVFSALTKNNRSIDSANSSVITSVKLAIMRCILINQNERRPTLMSDTRPVVVSGIRPTSTVHLGNYLGAIQHFVRLQETHRCLYFAADWHALTTMTDPKEIPDNIHSTILDFLAAGIDYQHATIFIQSSVPQIAELSWILANLMTVAELERCPTFKEKAATQPDNVNVGLLTYPVLMAADILIHKANIVPVGQDQLPHLEMARDLARTFNKRFGWTFPEPEKLSGADVRVPAIEGGGKMSKSGTNAILTIHDTPEQLREKCRRAYTDPKRPRREDQGHPWECNLFTLHEHVSGADSEEVQDILQGCQRATIGCSECKDRFANSVLRLFNPIRERREVLARQKGLVEQVLHMGAINARQSAAETLAEVRDKIGLVSY